MNAAPTLDQRDSEIENFLNALAARRFFLTINEARLARAFLDAGFSPAESEAFLRASEWGAYYRDCVRERHLPESAAVVRALRQAFDAKATKEEACSMAIEALRARYKTARAQGGKDPAVESEWWSEAFRFDV